ncbi:MAG: cyclic nucleotide-binding domain-containing protein [Fibrobacterota bacterium]
MRAHPLWTDFVSLLHVGRPDQMVDWLSRVAMFDGMHKRHLRHLARVLHRRAFEPGEAIFRQGDIGSGMYLIQSGRVRIVAEDPVRGEIQLVILEAGQAFGEMALFDHSPRSATAVAHGDCVLYGLFEGDLDQLERTRPQAAARLLRNLGLSIALRLRQTNERLHEMEEGSARGPF